MSRILHWIVTLGLLLVGQVSISFAQEVLTLSFSAVTPAILFSISDRPIMEALELYREERQAE